jgi:WD40 repeat protein
MKHDRTVLSAIWSKDETLILTWSKDDTARLWRARDGTPVGQPLRHDDEVTGGAWNRDETVILTWSDDNTARQWNVKADMDFPPEQLSLLVEVMTGTAMDDAGNITVLTADEWLQRKDSYAAIAAHHLTTCRYRDANLYFKQKPEWEAHPN